MMPIVGPSPASGDIIFGAVPTGSGTRGPLGRLLIGLVVGAGDVLLIGGVEDVGSGDDVEIVFCLVVEAWSVEVRAGG